ncbi:WXG100 family type VII secretion target [Lentzea sp. NPDC058436]|uniref:WXG100 family type VII secretion target n=1 Tax=Lentzea sp. NPDC058436 TaxID=3346499 RepID=UPI00365F6336
MPEEPDYGSEFTEGPGGGTYGVPNNQSSVADYQTWDWRQIMAAITGGAAHTGAGDAVASAVSNPETLRQAANTFYRIQVTLSSLADVMVQQAEAVAGRADSAWQGPAAASFLLAMRQFAASVRANAEQLSGGDAGLHAVPDQLLANANNLARAIATVNAIDNWYANQAMTSGQLTSRGLGAMDNGLIPVSMVPGLAEMIGNDMRRVLLDLAERYSITISAVRPPQPIAPPLAGGAAGLGIDPATGLPTLDPAGLGADGPSPFGAEGLGAADPGLGAGDVTPFSGEGLGGEIPGVDGLGDPGAAGLGEVAPFPGLESDGAVGAAEAGAPAPISEFPGLGELGLGDPGAGASGFDAGTGSAGDTGLGATGLGAIAPFPGLGSAAGTGAGGSGASRFAGGPVGSVNPELDRLLNPGVQPFEPGQFDEPELGGIGSGGIGEIQPFPSEGLDTGGVGEVRPFPSAGFDAGGVGGVGGVGDVQPFQSSGIGSTESAGQIGVDPAANVQVPTASDAGVVTGTDAGQSAAAAQGMGGMGGMPMMPPMMGGMGQQPGQTGNERSDASGLIAADDAPWVEVGSESATSAGEILSGEHLVGASAGTGALSGLEAESRFGESAAEVVEPMVPEVAGVTTGGPADDSGDNVAALFSSAGPEWEEQTAAQEEQVAGQVAAATAGAALGAAGLTAAAGLGIVGAAKRRDRSGEDVKSEVDSQEEGPEWTDSTSAAVPSGPEVTRTSVDVDPWDTDAAPAGARWSLDRFDNTGDDEERPAGRSGAGEPARATWKPERKQPVLLDPSTMPRSGDWDGVMPEQPEEDDEEKPDTPPAGGAPTRFALLLNEENGSWQGRERAAPGVLE